MRVAAAGAVYRRRGVRARVLDLKDLRRYADEPASAFRQTTKSSAGPRTYLALSGGGADGAYGAGVLNGWTEAGTRPSFSIVSGVSTGALIAPFAFLGPQYDPTLREFYTSGVAESLLDVAEIRSMRSSVRDCSATPGCANWWLNISTRTSSRRSLPNTPRAGCCSW